MYSLNRMRKNRELEFYLFGGDSGRTKLERCPLIPRSPDTVNDAEKPEPSYVITLDEVTGEIKFSAPKH